MRHTFPAVLTTLILFVASLGVGQASAQVFSDDFEGDLSLWTGYQGGSHRGTIVPDPHDPANSVLTFTAVWEAGDVFGSEFYPVPGVTYVLRFDYLGLPTPSTPDPDHTGGYIGITDGFELNELSWLGGTFWHAGLNPFAPVFVELIDDSLWHSYSIPFDPYAHFPGLAGPIRMTIEDWLGPNPPGNAAGDAFFDNVRIEPMQWNVNFAESFETGIPCSLTPSATPGFTYDIVSGRFQVTAGAGAPNGSARLATDFQVIGDFEVTVDVERTSLSSGGELGIATFHDTIPSDFTDILFTGPSTISSFIHVAHVVQSKGDAFVDTNAKFRIRRSGRNIQEQYDIGSGFVTYHTATDTVLSGPVTLGLFLIGTGAFPHEGAFDNWTISADSIAFSTPAMSMRPGERRRVSFPIVNAGLGQDYVYTLTAEPGLGLAGDGALTGTYEGFRSGVLWVESGAVDNNCHWVEVDTSVAPGSVLSITHVYVPTASSSDTKEYVRYVMVEGLPVSANVPAAPGLVLFPNYPNPFNPTTTISFRLPEATDVVVRVFDAEGRMVASLLDAPLGAGTHSVRWLGMNNSGRQVASGVYFARLTAGYVSRTQKMLLLK